MRRIFDEELSVLHEQFTEMGTSVKIAVKKAVKAFVKHDVELAHEAIVEDAKINKLESRIEKSCFTLIALQQPVASDLRRIVSMMKVIADLERIGDHAVNIAQSTIQVKGNERIEEVEKMLEDMASIVENMVSRVLKAYVSLDGEEARQISETDGAVDAYLKKISGAIVKYVQRNPDTLTGGMEYLLVAGYLERIGDYITNICERIVYTTTGKLVELN